MFQWKKNPFVGCCFGSDIKSGCCVYTVISGHMLYAQAHAQARCAHSPLLNILKKLHLCSFIK